MKTTDESHYRALADASFEAVFVSEKGVCIDTNKTATQMFGYSYEEIIGIFGTDVIAEESKELVLIQVGGQWPVQPRFLGTSHVLTNCTVGDRTAAGDRPVRQSALPFQTQDFSYFAHG